MVVVFYPVSRVVQHRRRAQHFHVRSGQLVQDLELLEQLYRKIVNVFGVRYVLPEEVEQRIDAVTEYVGDGLFVGRRHGVAEHRALAQTAARYHDLFQSEMRYYRVHRRERGREYVRSDAGQTFYLHRFVEIERAYVVVDAAELLRGDDVVVSHRQRIFFEHTADLAEIAERTSDSYQLGVGEYLSQPLQFRELFFDVVFYELRAFLRSVGVLCGKLGQHHRPERQSDVLQQILAVVIYELGTAPAYVHDKAARNVHGVDHALIYELRLFVLAEHSQLYARGGEHLVEESALVFGTSYRRGRICVDLFDFIGVAQAAEHLQRLDSLRHPRGLQKSVELHILSKAYGFLQFVDDRKIPAFENIHKH